MRFLTALLYVAAIASGSPTAAELNVPVAARVMSFVQPPQTGAVPVAVLFVPGNETSEAEAEAIDRAARASSTGIRTRRIPVAAMNSLSGYKVAFVTKGLKAEQGGIAEVAVRSSVLTISSDPTCVQSAHCVVGIATSPTVQITVNRAAARAAKIRFGSAFLMLVKEI